MRKYLVLLFVICAEIRVGDAYYSSEGLTDKITSLQDDVEVLKNEQEKMDKKLDKKLDKIIKLLGADIEDVDPTWPPLTLLNSSLELESIDKEDGGNTTRIKLTVWYRNIGHDDDVLVEWDIVPRLTFHNLSESRSEGVSDGDGMIWSTSTVIDSDSDFNYRGIILGIRRQDLDMTYSVIFEKLHSQFDEETTRVTSQFKVDTFEILNKGDLVYDEKREERRPTLKIRTHYVTTDPYKTDLITVVVETIGIDGELRTRTCDPDASYYHWNINCKVSDNQKKYRDYMEYEIELGQSGEEVTGFTSLYTSTEVASADWIHHIEFQQVIVVRPANQAGPYPDDMLDVKFGETTSLDTSTNAFEYTCRYDSGACPLSCEAHGNDLQELKLIKYLPNGETEQIKAEVQVLRDSTMMSARAILTPVANFSIVEDFKCVAKTNNGLSSERTVHVTYEYPIGIDTKESYLQYNETHFTAVCVAHGYPIPDVKMGIYYPDEHYGWVLPNVTVVQDPENFMVNATAVLVEAPMPLKYIHFYSQCSLFKPDGTKTWNDLILTQSPFPK